MRQRHSLCREPVKEEDLSLPSYQRNNNYKMICDGYKDVSFRFLRQKYGKEVEINSYDKILLTIPNEIKKICYLDFFVELRFSIFGSSFLTYEQLLKVLGCMNTSTTDVSVLFTKKTELIESIVSKKYDNIITFNCNGKLKILLFDKITCKKIKNLNKYQYEKKFSVRIDDNEDEKNSIKGEQLKYFIQLTGITYFYIIMIDNIFDPIAKFNEICRWKSCSCHDSDEEDEKNEEEDEEDEKIFKHKPNCLERIYGRGGYKFCRAMIAKRREGYKTEEIQEDDSQEDNCQECK